MRYLVIKNHTSPIQYLIVDTQEGITIGILYAKETADRFRDILNKID